MDFYYVDAAGESRGPVTQEELESLLQQNYLNSQSLIVPVGQKDWISLGQMFRIEVEAEPAPQAMSPLSYQRPKSRKSSTAVVLMPPATIAVFCSTATWARIVSIYWWIQTLIAFAMAALLFLTWSKLPKGLGVAENVFFIFGVIGFVVAGIFSFPANRSWAFGSLLADMGRNSNYLKDAAKNQADILRAFSVFSLLLVIAVVAILFLAAPSEIMADARRRAQNPSNPSPTHRLTPP